MNKYTTMVLPLAIAFLSACSPSARPTPVQITSVPVVALVPTDTPAPTRTPVPTDTPLPPTPTPSPTATATLPPTRTPTQTPTSTPTQTPRPTETPVPTATSIPFPSTKINHWEPMYSTPGTQLSFVELARIKGKDTTLVTYRLVANGVDTKDSYELWAFSLAGGEPQLVGTVNLDPNGKLQIDPLMIGKFSKGEALRAALVSPDRRTVVFGKAIPFPIVAKGAGDCSLSVELASPKGNAFWISGEGFVPKEEIVYISRSVQEEMSDKGTVDDQGSFAVFMFPAVVGQDSGAANYSVRGSACQVSVDYEWGPAALRAQ